MVLFAPEIFEVIWLGMKIFKLDIINMMSQKIFDEIICLRQQKLENG